MQYAGETPRVHFFLSDARQLWNCAYRRAEEPENRLCFYPEVVYFLFHTVFFFFQYDKRHRSNHESVPPGFAIAVRRHFEYK